MTARNTMHMKIITGFTGPWALGASRAPLPPFADCPLPTTFWLLAHVAGRGDEGLDELGVELAAGAGTQLADHARPRQPLAVGAI